MWLRHRSNRSIFYTYIYTFINLSADQFGVDILCRAMHRRIDPDQHRMNGSLQLYSQMIEINGNLKGNFTQSLACRAFIPFIAHYRM